MNSFLSKFLRGSKTEIRFKPVFIIGCGRSGTTIFGSTLGKHPKIQYLNERRDLWHKAFPDLDIWSGKSDNPQLYVSSANIDEQKSQLIRKLFFREQKKIKAEILLEKLPINNFRLEFLNTIFPDALYIYLHRNGLEVARSIEKMSYTKNWFGKNDIKWKLIESLAKERFHFDGQNLTEFEKGLVEWRLSLDYSEELFSKMDQKRFFSLSYQSFLNDPEFQVKKILEFLNLPCDQVDLNNMVEGIEPIFSHPEES